MIIVYSCSVKNIYIIYTKDQDHIIVNQDWSASNRIEVPGRQTLSGNPEIYTF